MKRGSAITKEVARLHVLCDLRNQRKSAAQATENLKSFRHVDEVTRQLGLNVARER